MTCTVTDRVISVATMQRKKIWVKEISNGLGSHARDKTKIQFNTYMQAATQDVEKNGLVKELV